MFNVNKNVFQALDNQASKLLKVNAQANTLNAESVKGQLYQYVGPGSVLNSLLFILNLLEPIRTYILPVTVIKITIEQNLTILSENKCFTF